MDSVLQTLLVASLCVMGFSQNIGVEDCPPARQENVFIKVYDDMCYYFHLQEKVSFKRASDICQNKGQRLIEPRTTLASGFLWFILIHVKKMQDAVWLGGVRDIDATIPTQWQSGGRVGMRLAQSTLKYSVPHTIPMEVGDVWIVESSTHPFVCELQGQKKKDVETSTTPTQAPMTTEKTTIPTTILTESTTATTPLIESTIPTIPLTESTTTTTPLIESTIPTTPLTESTTPMTTVEYSTTPGRPPVTSIPRVPSLVQLLCPHLPNSQRYMKLFGQTCFYFVLESTVTYQDAKTTCASHGGTLAIVKTKLIQDFIAFHLNHSFKGMSVVWIGLHSKIGTKTSYVWDDGSPLGYSNFVDSPRRGEQVMLYELNGKWYDTSAQIPSECHYVCQFDAKVQE